MEQRFLIDTNVIIDYTAAKLPATSSDFIEQLFNIDFIISVVVKIEVLGFNNLAAKMPVMEELLDMATVLPLDEPITQKTIELRRAYKIKLPDAIIAATALVHELVLVTRNTKDFRRIEGLEVLDPFGG